MAQFPLISSIFCDLFIKYQPQYSTLFSNHVARICIDIGMRMIRIHLKIKINILESGLKKKKSVFIGIDYIDNYLGFILNKEFRDTIILLTSSMGQEANPKFDNSFLAKYDGKIDNINLFSKTFKAFKEGLW